MDFVPALSNNPITYSPKPLYVSPSTDNNISTSADESTVKVLFYGYLRENLPNNDDHEQFPTDIITLCHLFIGKCPNLLRPEYIQLLTALPIMGHTCHDTSDKVQMHIYSLFGNDDWFWKPNSVSSKNIDQNNISKDYITKTLVAPYSIMMRDNSKETESYSLIEIPRVSTRNETRNVAASIHTPICGPKKLHSNITPLDVNIGALNEGVVQYLDVKRSRLMSFGGIGHNVNWHSHSSSRSINTQESYWTTNKILACELNTAQTMDSSSWNQYGYMKYKRGYMSLCNINESRLAIIGGKVCTSKLHESSTVDYVELFDPEMK